MYLHRTSKDWEEHYSLLPKNEQLNNVPHLFLRASNPDESKDARRQTLFADKDSMILVADGMGNVQLLHSPTNLGGNFLCPENKLVALIGSGQLSGPVVVDEKSLLAEYRQIEVPSFVELRECSTADEIKALSVQSDDSLDCSGGMLLLPFFRNIILRTDSLDPIVLLLAIIEAMNAQDFNEAMYEYGVDISYLLWSIYNGDIEGTKIALRMDDNEVVSYQLTRQSQCISSPSQRSHQDTSSNDGVLGQLSAAISMQNEETRESNNIRREELKLSTEKEELKRNKFEKLHSSTQNMILNASSTDGDRRAQELSVHAKSFFTKDSEGLADQDLKHTLDHLSQEDVAFAHGVVQQLRMGNFLYTNAGCPNNFSFFSFNEQSAGAANDDRQLIIHLTQSNSQGQTISMKDLKKLTKQFLLVPNGFNNFITQLLIFIAANECLFGEGASTLGLKSFYNQANGSLKQTLKQQMSSNPTFAAQVSYAIDIRVQEFLRDCKRASDRSEVNERVVDFNDLANDIRFGRFNIPLPPCFMQTSINENEDITTSSNDRNRDGGRDRDGGRERKRSRSDEPRVINSNQVEEFKMRSGENWRKDFCGKCNDSRVSWDDSSLMCVRWFTKGYCFDNCWNKSSHVQASQIPANKMKEYKEFLKKVRGEK